MATVRNAMAVDGEVLSNLDPEMVITLDDTSKVEIESKTADSITYKFLGEVAQDTTHTPNLTFIYKDKYKLTVPLSLKQKAKLVLETVDVPISSKVWDSGTTLPFKVMANGQDITSQLTDVKLTPTDNIQLAPWDNTKWYIVSDTSFAEVKAFKANWTYKLPAEYDPDQTVKTFEGTINAEAYDGVALKATTTATECKAPIGGTTTTVFNVWYKGLPEPAKALKLRSESSNGGPFTFGDSIVNNVDALTIVLDSKPEAGSGNVIIVIGDNTEGVVENVNIVTTTLPGSVYIGGLAIKEIPQEIKGLQGSTHSVKLSVEYDGVAVSNEDLEVTVADESIIKLVGKTATEITWEITKENKTGADVELTQQVDIKYQTQVGEFIQKVISMSEPTASVEWKTQDSDINPMGRNEISFSVKDAAGQPVSGLVSKSLKVKAPNAVINGYSSNIQPGAEPGDYGVVVTTSYNKGVFNITMVLGYPDKDKPLFEIPVKSYSNPGTPVTAQLTPNKLEPYDQTDVELRFLQLRTLGATEPSAIKVDITSATPTDVTIIDNFVATDETGLVFKGKVRSNKENSKASIEFELTEDYNGFPMYWTGVSAELDVTAPTKPRITDLTSKYVMELWDTAPLVYTIKVGEEDVTANVTSIVCDNAEAIKADFEFIQTEDGKWAFKSVTADEIDTISDTAELTFNVKYNETDFALKASVDLETKANSKGIPTDRFKVEIL